MTTASPPAGAPPLQVTVRMRRPHLYQQKVRNSLAKRKIIRAGRRGGKTVIASMIALDAFGAGKRVLYTAPTADQVDAFWFEINRALDEPLKLKVLKKDETEHFIEIPGTKRRIRAKTAWNADTMRGDFADLLIMDEWQLTDEDAWGVVGAPMLLDNDGDAIFIYTPPSLRSAGISKARDPRHAAKMWIAAHEDRSGRWEAFHFTSNDNPYISSVALKEIINEVGMSRATYQAEIMAQDDEMAQTKLVYGMWNESVCKIPRFEIPANWPRFSGHDFGTANPAAIFLAQVQLPLPPGAPNYIRMHDLIAYREYAPGPGFSTLQHVDRFNEFTTGHNVVKSIGGNQTTEEEIRQGYRNIGWNIETPVLKGVKAQIDRVHNLMETNRLYVFNDLVGLLDELFNCLWKLDNDGRITNDIDNEAKYHFCACLRYILTAFRAETIHYGNIGSVSIMEKR